jgi:hypothetical protein
VPPLGAGLSSALTLLRVSPSDHLRSRSGASVLKGQACVGNQDQDGLFSLDDGLYQIRYFRFEAIDLTRDDGLAFPAAELSALGDFFHSLLAAW